MSGAGLIGVELDGRGRIGKIEVLKGLGKGFTG